MEAKLILEQLFDADSFIEVQKHEDSSLVAGFGEVGGSRVCAYVQDIDVKSGAVSKNAAMKMKRIYAAAVKYGAPLISVFNSKGGEIGEGMELIEAYSEIIGDCARLSGVVPLISIVTGQCGGLNAALCRMSDFVVATEEAEMFFTPPFLGGKVEDIADIRVKDAAEAVLTARELLMLLPPNNLESNAVGSASNIKLSETIALGALGSVAAGLVTLGEKLTADDALRIARFVNFCDAFSLPVVTYIDNDGVEPCVSIRDTARLAQVYASAATPKVAVITGQACGAGFVLAGGFGNDLVLAYEGAVISPVAIKAAAAFLEMSEADYVKDHASAGVALKKGYVDIIIKPDDMQEALMKALDITRNKRVALPKRKHVNYVF
jgi:acetyl-CoA carboxylase carboxyltransferase component